MPLARYFYFVGGVLLALLFVLDACFPELPIAATPKVYLPVIRISSIEKLPERIVYDTSLPTIVPISVGTAEVGVVAPERIAEVASVASGVKEREALAMLLPSADRLQTSNARVQEPKPRYHRKIARRQPPARTIVMARHLQFGWFGRNFW
jgi:hypothetical protein